MAVHLRPTGVPGVGGGLVCTRDVHCILKHTYLQPHLNRAEDSASLLAMIVELPSCLVGAL